jgi:glycosyltransferase involved in cell wall biosynthesis
VNRHRLEESESNRGLVWCADNAIIHSQFTADELHAATGFPVDRMVPVPCCVDLQEFSPGSPPIDVRGQFHLGHARILLFVGRLAANKRVPLLVEALARLHDVKPPVHAVVVGDDRDIYAEQAQTCRRLAQQLGIADRLLITGPVDEATLLSWYRSADLLVIPSLHEGFCMPVIEAMACGLPVLASRAAALPETLGDAGLSFEPDSAEDLARKARLVLDSLAATQADRRDRFRVAIVAPRYGNDFVGGAETSLRTIAQALRDTGHAVEVFTTCNRHESDWTNHDPAGSESLDGIPVHRFSIDAHDRERHLAALDQIRHGHGDVTAAVEASYLENSLNSSELIAALAKRETEFDAIIVGPYLFGVTWNVARRFGKRVLLLPCFHNESLARLRVFSRVYDEVGGILYHSPEEQAFAQTTLGLNHPNAHVIGTLVLPQIRNNSIRMADDRPSVVYCGRYSVEKGVDQLLEFAQRYSADYPDRFRFVFMGQGAIRLPRASWLTDLGYVRDESKQAAIANARALIQLSVNESLSLVALEAWAAGVPVIGHRDCAAIRGQVQRSGGGETIADYTEFASTLNSLWNDPARWREMGKSGQRFVQEHYATLPAFAERITTALTCLRLPVAEQMRQKGYQRAKSFGYAAWEVSFATVVEQALSQPPVSRERGAYIDVRPLIERKTVSAKAPTALIPVRVTNAGTTVAAAQGPARIVLGYRMKDRTGKHQRIAPLQAPLPCLLTPGQSQVAVIPVAVPDEPGDYRVTFFARVPRQRDHDHGLQETIALELVVSADVASPEIPSVAGPSMLGSQNKLAEANELKTLPNDYADVTQGLFAAWKRLIKRKLLHNFRREYVDVLARQQSAFNDRIVTAICQLAEGLAAVEQSRAACEPPSQLARLQSRLRRCRRHLRRLERANTNLAERLAKVEQLLDSHMTGKEVST